MQSDNILKDAIAEARTLRKLSMSNARHSLVKFLKEEKLPLEDLSDAELDLDTFVDLIMRRSRERDEEEDELNQKGLPYLRKQNTDDELDERSYYSDDDEFEIDYGDGNVEKSVKKDDDKEDEDNFSDKAIDERNRKWQTLYGRPNFKTAPAIVSSGVGTTKLSQNERNLLLKHAGLIKENKKNRKCKESKDDLIRQRAGIKIKNRSIAKQVVSDIEVKKKLK